MSFCSCRYSYRAHLSISNMYYYYIQLSRHLSTSVTLPKWSVIHPCQFLHYYESLTLYYFVVICLSNGLKPIVTIHCLIPLISPNLHSMNFFFFLLVLKNTGEFIWISNSIRSLIFCVTWNWEFRWFWMWLKVIGLKNLVFLQYWNFRWIFIWSWTHGV